MFDAAVVVRTGSEIVEESFAATEQHRHNWVFRFLRGLTTP